MLSRQETLQAWLEEMPDAILLASPHGEILFANLRAHTMLSVDLSRYRLIDDLFDVLKSAQTTITRTLIRLRPGQESRLMVRLRQHPQRSFSVALRRSNSADHIVLSVREEIALTAEFSSMRDELESYRLLANNLPDTAFIVFDRDLRYVLADGEALTRSGYDPEKLLGKTLYEALPEASVKRLEPAYLAALDGNAHEFQTTSATGSTYSCAIAPLRDHDGEIKGGVLLILDVTTRLQHELELERRARQLAQLHGELSEFAQMLDEQLTPYIEQARSFLEPSSRTPDAELDRSRQELLAHLSWFEQTRLLLATYTHPVEDELERFEELDLAKLTAQTWRRVAPEELRSALKLSGAERPSIHASRGILDRVLTKILSYCSSQLPSHEHIVELVMSDSPQEITLAFQLPHLPYDDHIQELLDLRRCMARAADPQHSMSSPFRLLRARYLLIAQGGELSLRPICDQRGLTIEVKLTRPLTGRQGETQP